MQPSNSKSLVVKDDYLGDFFENFTTFSERAPDSVGYIGRSLIEGYVRNYTSPNEFIESHDSNTNHNKIFDASFSAPLTLEGTFQVEEAKNPTSKVQTFEGVYQIKPTPRLSPQETQRPSNTILGKWSGYVEVINGDEFTAVMKDTLSDAPEIRCEFSIEDVDEGDRKLVVEGAYFDWVICRERYNHGQIKNPEELIFKRFPVWRENDLDGESETVDSFTAWLKPVSKP